MSNSFAWINIERIKKEAEVIFILHSRLIIGHLFYDVHIDLLIDCSFYMDTYVESIRVKPFCIDFITFSTNVYCLFISFIKDNLYNS